MSMFRKAERRKAKLRLGLMGPAGSGKTFSALQIAFGLGGSIAVIDTENGSADLYAHLGEYDVCTLQPPYTVQKYLTAIEGAEKAGYGTIIIDSLSHAWAGEGGLLDQQGKLADSGKGNSYTAWRQVTPWHNKLVEAMLTSSSHIIATMRSKTEYVLETNDKGRQEPKKVGMAPVQREGMDYEFTVVFDLSHNHVAVASKDRTSLFDSTIFQPSQDTGKALLAWLETGEEAPPPKPAEPAATAEAPAAPAGSTAASTASTQEANPIVAYGQKIKALGFTSAEAKQIIAQVTGKKSGFTPDDFAALDEWIAKSTPPADEDDGLGEILDIDLGDEEGDGNAQ